MAPTQPAPRLVPCSHSGCITEDNCHIQNPSIEYSAVRTYDPFSCTSYAHTGMPTTTAPTLRVRATDPARSVGSENQIGAVIIGSIVGVFALAVVGVLVYVACTKTPSESGGERDDAEAVPPGGAVWRVGSSS